MSDNRPSHDSRKECSMFPKQLMFLFTSMFKADVFTIATSLSKQKQLLGMSKSKRVEDRTVLAKTKHQGEPKGSQSADLRQKDGRSS